MSDLCHYWELFKQNHKHRN